MNADFCRSAFIRADPRPFFLPCRFPGEEASAAPFASVFERPRAALIFF
jgi:hypothetical protein